MISIEFHKKSRKKILAWFLIANKYPSILSSIRFPALFRSDIHRKRETVEPGRDVRDPRGKRAEIAFQDQSPAERDFDRIVLRRIRHAIRPVPFQDPFEARCLIVEIVRIRFALKFALAESGKRQSRNGHRTDLIAGNVHVDMAVGGVHDVRVGGFLDWVIRDDRAATGGSGVLLRKIADADDRKDSARRDVEKAGRDSVSVLKYRNRHVFIVAPKFRSCGRVRPIRRRRCRF